MPEAPHCRGSTRTFTVTTTPLLCSCYQKALIRLPFFGKIPHMCGKSLRNSASLRGRFARTSLRNYRIFRCKLYIRRDGTATRHSKSRQKCDRTLRSSGAVSDRGQGFCRQRPHRRPFADTRYDTQYNCVGTRASSHQEAHWTWQFSFKKQESLSPQFSLNGL